MLKDLTACLTSPTHDSQFISNVVHFQFIKYMRSSNSYSSSKNSIVYFTITNCPQCNFKLRLLVHTSLAIDHYTLSIRHLDCIIITTFGILMYPQFYKIIRKSSLTHPSTSLSFSNWSQYSKGVYGMKDSLYLSSSPSIFFPCTTFCLRICATSSACLTADTASVDPTSRFTLWRNSSRARCRAAVRSGASPAWVSVWHQGFW